MRGDAVGDDDDDADDDGDGDDGDDGDDADDDGDNDDGDVGDNGDDDDGDDGDDNPESDDELATVNDTVSVVRSHVGDAVRRECIGIEFIFDGAKFVDCCGSVSVV